MDRRYFLKILAVSSAGLVIPPGVFAAIKKKNIPSGPVNDDDIKDYIYKIKNFDSTHPKDIILSPKDLKLLKSSFYRMKRVQRVVGHGNFCLLDFDGAVKTAKRYSRVGCFTKMELNFLEKIFYESGSVYGFMGQKPIKNITAGIKKSKTVKIPHSGNYVYKGLPFETYNRIRKIIGNDVVLTSGIRSIAKQYYLFLNKAVKNNGNMSLASRSLAPPGYSFHGVGDFDVGKRRFGSDNFTSKFTTTDVYKKLVDLEFIDFRYNKTNKLGVRFEPWHIKVCS